MRLLLLLLSSFRIGLKEMHISVLTFRMTFTLTNYLEKRPTCSVYRRKRVRRVVEKWK